MMRKSKLRKMEKKRKAERQRRRQKTEPLAYRGNKYKNEKFVPVIYQTEFGIYESFVMSERKMTDHDARAALESLIRGIRGGTIVVPRQQPPNDCTETEPADSPILWSIRRHWDECFEEMPFPGRDNLIGVLRTILGSIEVWGNVSPTSRGYLRYLEGFMGKLGVHCREVSPEFVAALEDGTASLEEFDAIAEDEEGDNELILAGRAWAEGADANAGIVFRALAEEMISAGEAKEVSESCQQLIGETTDRRIIDELSTLAILAQQKLKPAPSRLQSVLQRFIGK